MTVEAKFSWLARTGQLAASFPMSIDSREAYFRTAS